MSGASSRGPFPRSVTIALLLVGIVYAVTLGVIDRHGFWIVDNAEKFLQMESIIRSGFRDYSIPIAGREIDPGLRLNPIPLPFARVAEGKVYPVFSPVFAVVSSVPYRMFGMDGLYVLPFLCSLLVLLGIARIASRVLGGEGTGDPAPTTRMPALTILLAGLCTPLWFYSSVFWEHAIATALSVWAIWFYLSFQRGGGVSGLVAGSALCALGVWFRDELYLLCLALIAAQVLAARGRRRDGAPLQRERTPIRILLITLATTVAALAPLWIFQWRATGTPFGFHIETHLAKSAGILVHLAERPRVLYNMLIAFHRSPAISLAASVPLAVMMIVRPRVSERAFRTIVPLLGLYAAIGTAISLGGYFGPDGPIVALDHSNSLLPGAAILALGFLRLRSDAGTDADAGTDWLHRIALAYAGLYLLAAPELGSKGIHWGNRFLLILYPLLAVPAAANLCRWIQGWSGREGAARGGSPRDLALAGALAVTIATSLGAQVFSIHLLSKMTHFSARLNAAIKEQPESVIMTDTFWVPQFLYGEFFSRKILLVRSAEQLQYFRSRMRATGESRYLYLTGRQDPPDARPDLLVDDGGLRFFTVRVYRQAVP